MSEHTPSPPPFDPSRYTPEELDAARRVIHSLYRERPAPAAPEGPFDPSLYSADELTLAAEVAAALRKGPPSPHGPPEPPPQVSVTETPSVEWRRGRDGAGGSVVRLVLHRTTTTAWRGQATCSVEPLGALTDWFDCPEPPLSRRGRQAGGEATVSGATAPSPPALVPPDLTPLPGQPQPTTYVYSASGAAPRPPSDSLGYCTHAGGPPRRKPALIRTRLREFVVTTFFDGREYHDRGTTHLGTRETEYRLDESTGNYLLARDEGQKMGDVPPPPEVIDPPAPGEGEP